MGAAHPALLAAPEAQIVLPRDEATSPPVDAGALAARRLAGRGGAGGKQCSICLDEDPEMELECGHAFHYGCLDRWLVQNPTCPNCGRSYGLRIGNMPDGEMRWYKSATRLAGHTCGTIVLHFHFPPGADYAGRSQHAYLPDNAEGHQLLALFQLAFRRRVLFTLSQSLTTGEYRPNFSIHLKTATSGGAARHGYPDEEYYASALRELRAAGVEPEAAAAEALDAAPGGPGVSSCRLVALAFLGSVFSVCRLITFGCLVVLSVVSPAGKSVLLPLAACVMSLSCPLAPGTPLWCLLLLLTILLESGEDIPTSVRPTPSLCAVAFALAFALGARAARGAWRRPFLAVSTAVQRLVRRPAFQGLAVLAATAAVFFIGGPGPGIASGWPFLLAAAVNAAGSLVQERLLMRSASASMASAGPGLTQALLSRAPAARAGAPATVAAAPRLAPRRPAAPAPRPRQAEIGEADWPLFARCASLRGRPDAAWLHQTLLTQDALERCHANIAVRAMLQNELDFGDDYFVFYHSYSASCILYELQTALAARILGYPPDGPPVLRLDRRPFRELNSLEALLSVRTAQSSDHAVEFRRVAVSALTSWFASGEYRHPMLMHHFLRGYFGGRDLGDMTSMLEELLRACGLGDQQLRSLVVGVLELGERWGFEMSRYRDRGRPRVREEHACRGHVMQIFVHSSVVDAVAYGSKPLGWPASQGIPISAWLSRQCPLDGQARILAHPDLFLDTESGLAQVFTHSGSPIYGPAQRRELLGQLDALLAPIFGGPSHAAAAARAAARAGLGYDAADVAGTVPVQSVDDAV